MIWCYCWAPRLSIKEGQWRKAGRREGERTSDSICPPLWSRSISSLMETPEYDRHGKRLFSLGFSASFRKLVCCCCNHWCKHERVTVEQSRPATSNPTCVLEYSARNQRKEQQVELPMEDKEGMRPRHKGQMHATTCINLWLWCIQPWKNQRSAQGSKVLGGQTRILQLLAH